MTDYATNFNIMQALGNFTGGTYQYRMPQFGYMTSSIFGNADIASYAANLANLANMGNYTMFSADALNTSLSTPLWMQNLGNLNAPTQFDFTQLYTYNPFSQQTVQQQGYVSGDYEVQDNNGETVTVSELAASRGYKETTVDGVYTKNGSYYKYDVNKKSFVHCTKAEIDAAKKSDDAKAKTDKKEKAKAESAGIAADLYDAMKGAGTKNQKLQQAVEAINKDNIIEIFEQWDELYADSMDGESLIESIQREHYTGWFGNSQEKQEEAIVQALFERAESIGLKAEAAAARAKVKSEHGSWFSSDGNVRAVILDLVEKIKAAEA